MRRFYLLILAMVSIQAHAVLPQTGWYWQPTESGSGLNLQFQRTTAGTIFMFGAGFVYDDSGDPVWFTTSGAYFENDRDAWRAGGLIGSFSGERFESEGGNCLTCPYVPPLTLASGLNKAIHLRIRKHMLLFLHVIR